MGRGMGLDQLAVATVPGRVMRLTMAFGERDRLGISVRYASRWRLLLRLD